MGVPAFYRWLSVKYPLIIKDVVEDDPWDADGVKFDIDSSAPNPNGIECVPPPLPPSQHFSRLPCPVCAFRRDKIMRGRNHPQQNSHASTAATPTGRRLCRRLP
jgi:hypothetical protein